MRSTFVIMLLLFTASCLSSAQSGPSFSYHNAVRNTSGDAYVLTGRVKGSAAPFVYITHVENDQHAVDSAALTGGEFRLTGTVGQPELCTFSLDAPNGQRRAIYFYLQPGNISITAHIDSLGRAQIDGSPMTAEMKSLGRQLQPYVIRSNRLGSLADSIEKSGTQAQLDSVTRLFKAVSREKSEYVGEYVAAHPDSYPGAYYGAMSMETTVDAGEIYDKMGPLARASYSGMRIKALIDASTRTAIGSIPPDFTLNDPKGDTVALRSLRGKYVLLDFWASWCAPCRAESPNLLAAYRQNKQQNFAIISVSLDTDKANWKRAIENDHMEWVQVISEGEWNGEVVKNYGIRMIPVNFLLDPQGKIIAKDLRGESLPAKIASLIRQN